MEGCPPQSRTSRSTRGRTVVESSSAPTSPRRQSPIPGVTAVVDVGLEKVARYDAERAIDSLQTERISQAAADQRAGRAGRTGPGIAYRLWNAARSPQAVSRTRDSQSRPCRRRHSTSPDGAVTRASSNGSIRRDAEAIDAAMSSSEPHRARCEALALTDIGRRMLRLPLPPRLARILVAGNGTRDAVRAVTILAERYQSPARSETTFVRSVSGPRRLGRVP